VFLPLHDQNPIRHIRFPYVSYGLMAVTVAVFLVQLAMPNYGFEWFTVEYGMIPLVVRDVVPQPVVWLPDWANLVTYAFLHADWLHLLSNMLFLWVFGDNVEDALGHIKFLIFYLACAALAGLMHLAMNIDANGPLIGASGAVAGVLGAYLVLYPHARVFVLFRIVIPIPLPIPALWMLAVWIATQFFYAFIGSDEPTAWWAHIGGVIAGAILALPLKRRDVPLFGGR
jgi:membrane associated rhomboid family serine protease